MRRTARAAAGLFMLCGLAGCGGPRWYTPGQSYGRGQCGRMADEGARTRCENSAGTSYDSYKRQGG
ncbi:MAG TPA: hypothetical protein VGN52_06885 [Burkholderiales bacterium]